MSRSFVNATASEEAERDFKDPILTTEASAAAKEKRSADDNAALQVIETRLMQILTCIKVDSTCVVNNVPWFSVKDVLVSYREVFTEEIDFQGCGHGTLRELVEAEFSETLSFNDLSPALRLLGFPTGQFISRRRDMQHQDAENKPSASKALSKKCNAAVDAVALAAKGGAPFRQRPIKKSIDLVRNESTTSTMLEEQKLKVTSLPKRRPQGFVLPVIRTDNEASLSTNASVTNKISNQPNTMISPSPQLKDCKITTAIRFLKEIKKAKGGYPVFKQGNQWPKTSRSLGKSLDGWQAKFPMDFEQYFGVSNLKKQEKQEIMGQLIKHFTRCLQCLTVKNDEFEWNLYRTMALCEDVTSVQCICDQDLVLAQEESNMVLLKTELDDATTFVEPLQPDKLYPCAELGNGISDILSLLPKDLSMYLKGEFPLESLKEIRLECGERPAALVGDREFSLGGSDRIVLRDEIKSIVRKVQHLETEGCLHKISFLQNMTGDVVSIHMRIVRHFSGCSAIIADIANQQATKSILLIGEPETGKTTLLRDIAGKMSMNSDVVVVDVTNDIAGDAKVPHSSIGKAKLVKVPLQVQQSHIVLQILEDASPATVLIVNDSFAYGDDLEVAYNLKNQGKCRQFLTSIECTSLRDALEYPHLQQIFGVTSDWEICEERSAPLFDCVVEATPGKFNEWRVIHDVRGAVDSILDGETILVEKRTRDLKTGCISVEMEYI